MTTTRPRQTLHLALYEERFALMVQQYAAQSLSGRFMPNENLTSGNRRYDRKTLNQFTRVFVPIVSASPVQPSILRFYETGTPFYFEHNNLYQLKHAFDLIDQYLTAGIAYLRENYGRINEEIIDAYERLGGLVDELASRLSLAGYAVKDESVVNILSILSNRGNKLNPIKETRYVSLINSLSRSVAKG